MEQLYNLELTREEFLLFCVVFQMLAQGRTPEPIANDPCDKLYVSMWAKAISLGETQGF